MLIVCLFVGVLWLVCGVQGSRGYYIVWCLHLGPFPVLQRSTETKGCSVFKSIVCHLNEAFRAKKKKKRKKKIQHENTTMCWTLARTRDVLGICWFSCLACYFSLCILWLLSTHGSPGPLVGEKRHEIDIISLNAARIWRENTVIHWLDAWKINHITPSPLPLSP